MRSIHRSGVFWAVGLAFCSAASAGTITFEGVGLTDGAVVPVGAYAGLGIAINGATSFLAASAGGSIPFLNMPSADTAITATAVNGNIFIDAPGGFTGSVSVFYSANGSFNHVTVFAGLDGAGGSLGTSANFVDNRSTCNPAGGNPGDPGCWTLATVNFAGTGQSIQLPTNAGSFYFDNVTLTLNAVATPEPATSALVGGLLVVGMALARRLRS